MNERDFTTNKRFGIERRKRTICAANWREIYTLSACVAIPEMRRSTAARYPPSTIPTILNTRMKATLSLFAVFFAAAAQRLCRDSQRFFLCIPLRVLRISVVITLLSFSALRRDVGWGQYVDWRVADAAGAGCERCDCRAARRYIGGGGRLKHWQSRRKNAKLTAYWFPKASWERF